MPDEPTNTPAEPTPAVEPTPADPAPEFDDVESMVESVIQFDPFAQGEEAPAEGPAPGTEPPAPAPEGEPPVAEPGTPAPVEAPAPEENPEMAAMRTQLEQANALVASYAQLVNREPAGGVEGEETPDAPPAYNFNIPDDIMSGFGSEDAAEQKRAVAALMNGVAQSIHQTVRNEFAQRLATEVPNVINERVQQQAYQQTVFSDFYQAHPDLNRPELRTLVVDTARTLMGEMTRQGRQVAWTPQLRDAVATRVKQILVPPAPVVAPVQPAPVQASVRPAQGNSEIADIQNTLFGGSR
jgi:hypothetical protein